MSHSAAYYFTLWCVMTFCWLTVTICYGRLLSVCRRQGKMIDELLDLVGAPIVEPQAKLQARLIVRGRIDN